MWSRVRTTANAIRVKFDQRKNDLFAACDAQHAVEPNLCKLASVVVCVNHVNIAYLLFTHQYNQASLKNTPISALLEQYAGAYCDLNRM